MAAATASPTLVLVDGSSYLYRAFHAMPDLRAVPGDPTSPATGAIRGMINMMQSLEREHPGHYVACVFDASGPTFRDELYPEYKAHRSPMPEDLRAQIPPIHELVKLLGWTVLNVPGVEADDVIGTLARTAAAQGVRVIVSSGDKDLSQLVDGHITIIDTMNGKRRDVAGVEAEFGVPPRLMVDFQTLVGDTIDNVPGVEKVGPKTAAKWLQEYGSLEGVVANAAHIKGVAGENLRKALDWLPLGRQLLTIKTDCDLSEALPRLPALDELVLRERDTAALLAFYEQYGFKGLARALGGGGEGAGARSPAAARAAGRKASHGGASGDLFSALLPMRPATLKTREMGLQSQAQPRRTSTTKPSSPGPTWSAGWPGWKRPIWWRWTPRPPRSMKCVPRSWAYRSACSRARRPMCR
jgi:DNA polymerase I